MNGIPDWLHIGFANNGVKMYWIWIKTPEGSDLPVFEVTEAQQVPPPESNGFVDRELLLNQLGLLQGPMI